jgi:hypothetical protein
MNVSLRDRARTTRKFWLVATVLLAMALAAIAASPALASTDSAAGSFVEGPETILDAQFADGNEIYHLTREATFSGSYSGVGLVDQRIVIHKDGSFNVQMTIDFTGVACGQPTTLTFHVTGQGDFTTNDFTGAYAVIGPADVGKGQGTFSAVPGVGGTYAGQIHC